MSGLTEQDLAAMQQRCDAASAPPWEHAQPANWHGMSSLIRPVGGTDQIATIPVAGWKPKRQAIANGDFIAAARSDMPLLLAHVASQAARIAELEAENLLLRDELGSAGCQMIAALSNANHRAYYAYHPDASPTPEEAADMERLCDEAHRLGLRLQGYRTPAQLKAAMLASGFTEEEAARQLGESDGAK